MIHDLLMGAAAIFSGITTAVVMALAFKWGRWTGTVDTRLANIERCMARQHKEEA